MRFEAETRPWMSAGRGAHVVPIDAATYAAALLARAGGVLDPASLHSWMAQRLMLDLGLEHARAVHVTDQVLEHEAAVARRRSATQHHVYFTGLHLRHRGGGPAASSAPRPGGATMVAWPGRWMSHAEPGRSS